MIIIMTSYSEDTRTVNTFTVFLIFRNDHIMKVLHLNKSVSCFYIVKTPALYIVRRAFVLGSPKQGSMVLLFLVVKGIYITAGASGKFKLGIFDNDVLYVSTTSKVNHHLYSFGFTT